MPEEQSPAVVDVDLSQVDPLGKLGDVELISLPAQTSWTGGTERWLVARRGQTVLDTQNIGSDTLRIAPRAAGLHILRVSESMRSPLGTGACGSCSVVDLSLVKLEARGRFSKPEELAGTYSEGEELSWESSLDLSRIDVFLHLEEGSKQLSVRLTLDPKTGRYKTERFPRPGQEEEEDEDSSP
jgi:hypothetical protein